MPTWAVYAIVKKMSTRTHMHAGERAIKRGREWCVVGSDYAAHIAAKQPATNPPVEAFDQ